MRQITINDCGWLSFNTALSDIGRSRPNTLWFIRLRGAAAHAADSLDQYPCSVERFKTIARVDLQRALSPADASTFLKALSAECRKLSKL